MAAGVLVVALPLSAADEWAETSKVIADLEDGRCSKAVQRVNSGLRDGEPAAYYLVGTMHLRGLCVAKAPEKAREYLEPAARAGYYGAARVLSEMYGLGLGVTQSYAEAGRWAQAMQDISRSLAPGRPASSPAATSAAPIPIEHAELLGVVATMRSLVQNRMEHPHDTMRTWEARHDSKITVLVTLGPDGLAYRLGDSRAGTSGSDRADTVHARQLSLLLDKIVREMPPVPKRDKPEFGQFDVAFQLR